MKNMKLISKTTLSVLLALTISACTSSDQQLDPGESDRWSGPVTRR